jgi:hypothetical protein
MGWRDMKSLRQLLVGDGGLALRDVFEECAHPCMRRHPIVLSPKLGATSGMVTSSHRRNGRQSKCGPASLPTRRETEGSNLAPSRGESKTNPPRLRTRISCSRGVRTRPGYRPLYPLDLVYNNGSPPAPAPRKSGPTQAIVFPIPAEPIPAERQARQRREEEGFHRFAPEKPKPLSCLPAGQG